MKMYGDDAELSRLLEVDDRDYETVAAPEPVRAPRRQRVKSTGANGHGAAAADPAPAAVDPDEEDDEFEAGETWDEEAAERAAMQLQDAIDGAEDVAEMHVIGAQLKAGKKLLGEKRHDGLLKIYQEKFKRMSPA